MSSLIEIYGAFTKDNVDFVIGVLLVRDLSDVLDGLLYIIGDWNPRRPTTALHVFLYVTHTHTHIKAQKRRR